MSVPPDDDEPVPRLPRGRGMKLDGAMIARIGMTLALLVMIVVTARPCANATSKFVTGFGEEGSGKAKTQMPKPGNVDVPAEDNGSAGDYERMGGTDAEQRAAFERAKAKAAARAAERAGSGAGSATGSGSAAAGSGSATTP